MKLIRTDAQNPSLVQSIPRWSSLWNEPFLAFPRFLNDVMLNDAHWDEDVNKYTVRFEVPGLKKDEIKLTFENGLLTLRGNKRVRLAGEEKTLAIERSVAIPEGVLPEKIEANYEDGVLEVVLPKREEVKPKEISIQVK